MKRTILSLAVAAALVLPAAVSHALPAAADYGVNVLCPMQQPSFSGTFDQRHYSFTLACYGNQNFQVSASYSNTTHQAVEKFVGMDSSQGYALEAMWNCPADPWGTYQEPVCTSINTLIAPDARGFLGGYDLSHSTLPYSAQSLSGQDHGTLWEDATQAERQQSQQPPAAPPANVDQHLNDATNCVACGGLFGMPGYETVQTSSTVCIACLVAAASPSPSPTPSPTPSSGRSLNSAPACLVCQIPGR